MKQNVMHKRRNKMCKNCNQKKNGCIGTIRCSSFRRITNTIYECNVINECVDLENGKKVF